jgi:hypothetical protein
MIAVMLVVASVLAGQEALAGSYVRDVAASDDINKVIHAATTDFNFIKRLIARKRLRDVNPPTNTLVIKMVGDSIEFLTNGNITLRSKPNSGPMDWRGFRGELFSVETTYTDGVLTHTFTAGDGQRRNSYTLQSDGSLVQHVRLTSPQLKRPVEYRQVFRRAS